MPAEDREQRIRELAYSIWEQEGRPHGQAERHWEMARKAVETFELAEVAVVMNADGVPDTERPITSKTLEACFDGVRKPDAPKRPR